MLYLKRYVILDTQQDFLVQVTQKKKSLPKKQQLLPCFYFVIIVSVTDIELNPGPY